MSFSSAIQSALGLTTNQNISNTGATHASSTQNSVSLAGSTQYAMTIGGTSARTEQNALSGGSISQGTYTYAAPNAARSASAVVIQRAETDGSGAGGRANIVQSASIDPNSSLVVQDGRNFALHGTTTQSAYVANSNGAAVTSQFGLASNGVRQTATINNSGGTVSSASMSAINTGPGAIAQTVNLSGAQTSVANMSAVNLGGSVNQSANVRTTG